MSYENLASLAVAANGFETEQQIVNLLWTNIVGSTPTADQAQPYINMLTSAGQFVVFAADTDLNQANINLVGLITTGLEYV